MFAYNFKWKKRYGIKIKHLPSISISKNDDRMSVCHWDQQIVLLSIKSMPMYNGLTSALTNWIFLLTMYVHSSDWFW